MSRGDKARLIHTRNNWMIGVRKKAMDAGVEPDSFPEYILAIEVGELFGEAMRTRLSRIPSDLFERGRSAKQLRVELTKLLKDSKKG